MTFWDNVAGGDKTILVIVITVVAGLTIASVFANITSNWCGNV